MTATLGRIAVRVPATEAEVARAVLLDAAPGGFEECEGDGWVELVAYGDIELERRVRAVFPTATTTAVPLGWEDAWRAFHRPVVVGGVWIGPPWEVPPPAQPAVVIDPGRAFGTGAHATTRLCVELLATLERGSLLDVGCGSGVLGLAAARLGFGPLHAVDDDPVAVAVTRENAERNDVSVTAWIADALSDELPAADVAAVNILLPAVDDVLPRLPTRFAVTSGYLAGERPHALGWRPIDRRETDGWAADVLVRD